MPERSTNDAGSNISSRFVAANANSAKGERPVTAPFPETLQLDVTERCNLRCVMCPTGSRIAKGKHIDTAAALAIIDEAVGLGVKNVGLYMTGEPLLHPDIALMAERAKGLGCYVYITTNGLLLTEAMADTLIQIGVDSVKFSVDAANAADYAAVRRGGNFDTLLRNMTMMREKVDAAGSSMRLSAGFVVMSANFTEEKKEAFRSRFSGIVHATWFTFMNTLGVDNPDKSAQQKAAERRDGEAAAPGGEHVCPQLWNRLVISADLELVACCADFSGALVYGRYEPGNLASVWNGEKMKEWRRGFLEGTLPDSICRECTSWRLDITSTMELNG